MDKIILTFTNLHDNPGYLNDAITKEQCKAIAEKLNLKAEKPSSGNETVSWSTEDESILLEVEYGVSFELELRSDIEEKLLELDFITLHKTL